MVLVELIAVMAWRLRGADIVIIRANTGYVWHDTCEVYDYL